MDDANGSLKGPKASKVSKASKTSKSKAAMNGAIKSALNGHAAHPKTATRTAGTGFIWRTLSVAARYAFFSPLWRTRTPSHRACIGGASLVRWWVAGCRPRKGGSMSDRLLANTQATQRRTAIFTHSAR